MNKTIDLNKRSKKEQKAFYKTQRVTNGFNTGTRDMSSEKYPTRAKRKSEERRMANND